MHTQKKNVNKVLGFSFERIKNFFFLEKGSERKKGEIDGSQHLLFFKIFFKGFPLGVVQGQDYVVTDGKNTGPYD